MKRIIIIPLLLLLLAAILVEAYRHSSWYNDNEKNKRLTLYGNVDVRQVDLGFRVSGRVTSMLFEEGDLVPKNTLMALLDKQPYEDLVKQAQAQVLGAQAGLENAKQLYERRQVLVDS